MGPPLGLIVVGVLAVVAVGAVIATLVSGGDDQADTTSGRSTPGSGRLVEARTIGARIRKPRGWSEKRARRLLSLSSPDRTVLLSVSLPPGAKRSRVVLRTAFAAIRRQYRRVRVVGIPKGRRLAKRPTLSVVTSATNRRGVKLSILTAVPQGRKRAWLVQVFAARGAGNVHLAPAQRALGTLRLAG